MTELYNTLIFLQNQMKAIGLYQFLMLGLIIALVLSLIRSVRI